MVSFLLQGTSSVLIPEIVDERIPTTTNGLLKSVPISLKYAVYIYTYRPLFYPPPPPAHEYVLYLVRHPAKKDQYHP